MKEFRIETSDWIDTEKYHTLKEAKNAINERFTDNEREKMFNDNAHAKIIQYEIKKDKYPVAISATDFNCGYLGVPLFSRSYKI